VRATDGSCIADRARRAKPVGPIRDRMPVVLRGGEAWHAWLHPSVTAWPRRTGRRCGVLVLAGILRGGARRSPGGDASSAASGRWIRLSLCRARSAAVTGRSAACRAAGPSTGATLAAGSSRRHTSSPTTRPARPRPATARADRAAETGDRAQKPSTGGSGRSHRHLPGAADRPGRREFRPLALVVLVHDGGARAPRPARHLRPGAA
jgi:hypothetical protein